MQWQAGYPAKSEIDATEHFLPGSFNRPVSCSSFDLFVEITGGNALRAEAARAVVGAGIAVMGHTGLMPQSVSVLGGFGPQGRTADSALLVIQDAVVRTLPLS